MQLREANKIDIDKPISTYLPNFHPRNPFDNQGSAPFCYRQPAEITLRHLLSHTSGLVGEAPAGHAWDQHPPSLREVVESLNSTSLVVKPGMFLVLLPDPSLVYLSSFPSSCFSLFLSSSALLHQKGSVIKYSNAGMTVCGYLVEHISQMPFKTYAKKHLLEPMG
jgi:CubicO group peptidase (beta-lactamase class C family)